MVDLKTGTLCVIVAGCPENIGMIVEVVSHLGRYGGREDAYEIKTVTGRNFNQLWVGKNLHAGTSTYAVTDRYKLRPLVEDGAPDLMEVEELVVPKPETIPA
jgi:hypothetical protein